MYNSAVNVWKYFSSGHSFVTELRT